MKNEAATLRSGSPYSRSLPREAPRVVLPETKLPGGGPSNAAGRHHDLMRSESAKLRRHRREMRAAISDMMESALALADYAAASAPDRPVCEEELAAVEAGVVSIVLDQTRERLKQEGASEARLAYLDGVGAESFRTAFSRRFRKQVALAVADHGGTA